MEFWIDTNVELLFVNNTARSNRYNFTQNTTIILRHGIYRINIQKDEEQNQEEVVIELSGSATDSGEEQIYPKRKKQRSSSSRGCQARRYVGDFELSDMDDPEKARKFFTIVSQRMDDYLLKIRTLTQMTRRLNNRIAYQKMMLKMTKEGEDDGYNSGVPPKSGDEAKKKTIWVIKCD
ncbi:hypothetical protein JTB14_022267 [Gonioctena quinquepunctata]|nr:hypothetical protein JTB14_022267 [Gonioctena quinquepunctata]